MIYYNVFRIPRKTYNFPYPCNISYECSPIILNIEKGTYLFELWGAGRYSGGGYVRGEIHLFEETTTFFLYVGGVSPIDRDKCGIGGYNGGGYSDVIGESGTNHKACRSFGGNGATDIRLNETLESRILVAAGSGGGGPSHSGGFGGGFTGGDGYVSPQENNWKKNPRTRRESE